MRNSWRGFLGYPALEFALRILLWIKDAMILETPKRGSVLGLVGAGRKP
jgi:hypothetical protein